MGAYKRNKLVHFTSLRYMIITSAALSLTPGDITFAEEKGAVRLDEVIVTAQKREESLQDVSISVSAYTQDSLDKQGVSDVFGLANKVPTMHLQAPNGVVWGFMRGTGNSNPTAGGDNSLAFHYDGVYMGVSSAAMVDMWDVERAEILRGPQGTLFGRNATGGSINVIPNYPVDEFDFNADFSVGSDDMYRVRGMINPGRHGIFSSRAAFSYVERDGFQDNLEPGFDNTDADDSWMLRLIGQFDIGEQGSLALTFLGAETDAVVSSPIRGGVGYSDLYDQYVTNPKPMDPRKVSKNVDEDNEFTTYGLTAKFEYGLDSVALKAIGAYYEIDRFIHNDWDGSELAHLEFVDNDEVEQQSLEIQLLSQDWDKGNWIVGAYWFEMDNSRLNNIFVADFSAELAANPTGPQFFLPPLRVSLGGELEAKSYAVFGQVNYDLSENLQLTAGARYAWDKKKSAAVNYMGPAALFGTPIGDSMVVTGGFDEDWSEPLARIALDWQLSEDSMVYVSVSRGYKAGGFTAYGLSDQDAPAPDGLAAAEPETVLSYEVGSKNMFFDQRLQLNASAYLAQYQDIQQAKFFPGSFAPGFFSVGDGDAFGVEVDWKAVITDQLRIDGNIGYIDTEYDGSMEVNMATCGVNPPFICQPAEDIAGNQFVATPTWSTNLGVEYEMRFATGSLIARVDWSHKSRTYYTLFEDKQRSQSSYNLYDFRLMYQTNSNWDFQAYINNVTDEDVIHTMFSGSSLLGSDSPVVWYAAPRTYGMKIGYHL